MLSFSMSTLGDTERHLLPFFMHIQSRYFLQHKNLQILFVAFAHCFEETENSSISKSWPFVLL